VEKALRDTADEGTASGTQISLAKGEVRKWTGTAQRLIADRLRQNNTDENKGVEQLEVYKNGSLQPST
jgi:hypothetical protein